MIHVGTRSLKGREDTINNENAQEFGGKPVQLWEPQTGIVAPEQFNYRIAVSWEDGKAKRSWLDLFAVFLADPNAAHVTGLVVGQWLSPGPESSTADIVEALVVAREQLPNLTAIFLGDLISEENEISWILQTDVSPLFSAYPRLEHFRVRGGTGLRFGALAHTHLKSLIVETGGLPTEPLRDLMSAQLPALEHLEIWLGDSGYGWSGEIDDFAPLFAGELFPQLRYLGLRNSEITDEIATAIATSPIMQRIRVLDLSLGTLSDEGAAALILSPYLTRLEKLDLHHHYLSPEMMFRLTGVQSEGLKLEPPLPDLDVPLPAPPGAVITIDVSDRREADVDDNDTYRYVAVGE